MPFLSLGVVVRGRQALGLQVVIPLGEAGKPLDRRVDLVMGRAPFPGGRFLAARQPGKQSGNTADRGRNSRKS